MGRLCFKAREDSSMPVYDDERALGKPHNARLSAEHLFTNSPGREKRRSIARKGESKANTKHALRLAHAIRHMAPSLAEMLEWNVKGGRDLSANSWHAKQAIRAAELLLAGDYRAAVEAARHLTGIPERETANWHYTEDPRVKAAEDAATPKVSANRPRYQQPAYGPHDKPKPETWRSTYQPIDLERDPLRTIGTAYQPPTLED
jgi:hypothetical protein